MGIPTGRRALINGAAQIMGIASGVPGVKSVQKVEEVMPSGSLSRNATIVSVDVNNTMFIPTGHSTDGVSGDLRHAAHILTLTNATTVTGTRNTSGVQSYFSGVVIEFFPNVLASLQTGTISLIGGDSFVDATITAVSANAIVFSSGFKTATTSPANIMTSVAITTSTNVRVQRPGTVSAVDHAFTIIDFN